MAREPRAPQKHQPQQGGGGQPPASQVAWHARPQLPHETRPSQALHASLEEGPGADCSSSVSSQGAQQTRGAARLARGRLTCARPARVSEMAREPKSTLAPRRASPRRGGGKEGLARPGTHASDDLPHAPSLGPLAAAPCRAFWLPRHHAKRMTWTRVGHRWPAKGHSALRLQARARRSNCGRIWGIRGMWGMRRRLSAWGSGGKVEMLR